MGLSILTLPVFILILVVILYLMVKVVRALKTRRTRSGRHARATAKRRKYRAPRPSIGFWINYFFTALFTVFFIGGIGALIGAIAAGGNAEGGVAGVIVGIGILLFPRLLRGLARIRKRRCLATLLSYADDAPVNSPIRKGTLYALFDCNGRRIKLKLTSRQSWIMSASGRVGELGHLTYAGKHLFRWEPVSAASPDRPPVGATAFLSYTHEEAQTAQYLAQVLKAHGLDVWVDEDRLQTGDPLRATLPDEIKTARFFILLLSQNYLESQWCMRELRAAVDSKADIRPVKLNTEKLEYPPAFKTLFEQDLGEPVYLDANKGNLPARLDAFGVLLAELAEDTAREQPAPVRSSESLGLRSDTEIRDTQPESAADLYYEINAKNIASFDVSNWLANIGLGKYTEEFRTNDIDSLDLLRSLNDADLKDIGVVSLGHRKILLAEIQAIGTARKEGQARS